MCQSMEPSVQLLRTPSSYKPSMKVEISFVTWNVAVLLHSHCTVVLLNQQMAAFKCRRWGKIDRKGLSW